MKMLEVGTRIYNHGDMANPSHFGTISRVIVDHKWGSWYEITPDAGEERTAPYRIPIGIMSPHFSGHHGTRFVTEEEYKRWRAERLAEMQAAMVRKPKSD